MVPSDASAVASIKTVKLSNADGGVTMDEALTQVGGFGTF